MKKDSSPFGIKREQQAPYSLRCPPELMEKLRQSAEANMRSLHMEIVFRLKQSFKEQQ